MNVEAFAANNDVSYYLLGAMLTDGNICKRQPRKPGYKRKWRMSITSMDIDWMQQISRIIGINLRFSKNNLGKLDWENGKVADWLLDNNCIPRKSKIVKMPNVPHKYLPDFIRGVIDGDGSINSGKYQQEKKRLKNYFAWRGTVYICSASKIFISGLASKLTRENFKPLIIKVIKKTHSLNGKLIIPTCPQWRLLFNGTQAAKFLNWVYYNGNKIAMPRKTELVKTLIANLSKRAKGCKI